MPDSTRVCMLTQYLHTRACLYMANVASLVASYLPFSLSYNATILVTMFFPYRAFVAHQGVEDEIEEEVELASLIM